MSSPADLLARLDALTPYPPTDALLIVPAVAERETIARRLGLRAPARDGVPFECVCGYLVATFGDVRLNFPALTPHGHGELHRRSVMAARLLDPEWERVMEEDGAVDCEIVGADVPLEELRAWYADAEARSAAQRARDAAKRPKAVPRQAPPSESPPSGPKGQAL